MVEGSKDSIEFIYCGCGCQKTLPKYNRSGQERKFINGHNNRGIKFTEERKLKIGKSLKGRIFSEETRQKLRVSRLGKPVPETIRKKLSESLKGENNPFYGKKHSEETRKILSQKHTGKILSEEHRKNISKAFTGEKNPAWKGDDVGYVPLHLYIRKRLPKPELCQICLKVPPFELSNKSGKYLRDLTDWWWLCISCHRKYDNWSFKVRKK